MAKEGDQLQDFMLCWLDSEVMLMLFSLSVVLTMMVPARAMVRQMTIAAIFDQGGDRKHELAFTHAVQSINMNR